METVVGGLVVAAVTGLTFIAYKHPKGSQHIFFFLSAILAVWGFIAMGWNFAIGAASIAVVDAVNPEQAAVAKAAVDRLATPFGWELGRSL